ncbi:MAG: sulfite exporter TauE/SafE family protein [Candidatus Magnetoovum sp. WYHC-5]|nr:sulfite exporter TauE/SafE family protein [Candidatus Magnetoovum sp. WYHC-5]
MDWTQIHLPIAGVDIVGWQLILIGLTVGIIGGFFGVGGAFMVTPALNVFGFPMAYAIGTDMAHMAGKSIVATIKHRKLGNVDMKLGLLMVVFTAVGIEVGATTIMWLEKIGRVGPVVRIVYMVLLFSLGLYMVVEYIQYMRLRKRGHDVSDAKRSALSVKMTSIKLPPMINLQKSGVVISLWVIAVLATFTGFIAGFLGVGGGFIRMPALMYVIGCPTTVAVGTDLFEVMISGAYGAFSYAMKGRVEIFAAIVMLLGAAVGAQFGTLATKYVKGLTIRLYFAITMITAGVSVVFKHVSSNYKYMYESSLNAWIKLQTGLTEKDAIKDWTLMNKAAVKSWIAGQSETLQHAYALEKIWNNYAGYLMLGSACILSSIILVKMTQGIIIERRLNKLETVHSN